MFKSKNVKNNDVRMYDCEIVIDLRDYECNVFEINKYICTYKSAFKCRYLAS